MKIAFIGLGHMGGPMALNLHRAGRSLRAFDLSADAMRPVAEAGVPMAASAADAVDGAEVVISMLPASRHVEALYLGDGASAGLLGHIASGALVIDSSTISVASASKVAHAGVARGLAVVDAPVSGGTAGARAGTLTFMVGGAAAHVDRARPVLAQMGSHILHAGGPGAGQAAKICNNMLLGILMIGTSEALTLGAANGLDPSVLSEIMRRSSGGNWALDKYNPYPGVMASSPASNHYTGGFSVDLMLKDLGLAQDSALSTGAATPLGALARSLYAAHSLAGRGALDFSSILQLLQPH